MSLPRLVRVTLNTRDLDAAIAAWRASSGVDFARAAGGANAVVSGIELCLEPHAASVEGLAGVELAVDDPAGFVATAAQYDTSGRAIDPGPAHEFTIRLTARGA